MTLSKASSTTLEIYLKLDIAKFNWELSNQVFRRFAKHSKLLNFSICFLPEKFIFAA